VPDGNGGLGELTNMTGAYGGIGPPTPSGILGPALITLADVGRARENLRP
jgi:hypothetical protein